MSTTDIYIMRHGQSEGNKYDLFLGHTDLDLSEKGHMQAEITANYLKTIHTDAIYSSDLLRAYNTAKHTADKIGMEIIKSENLREIYAGEWENQTFNFLKKEYEKDYDAWVNDFENAKCTGGESAYEVQKRIVTELKKIASENPCKTVFIFSHATVIRVLQAYVEKITPNKIKWATNASVTHIKYSEGEFIPVEYSKDSHLGSLSTALPDNV